jgi:UDP-glucose 4-epimerase
VRKALVTGGIGFIGCHLSARLLAEGFEVHAFDNQQRGNVDAQVESLMADSRYRLILGDLMDESSLAALGGGYTHVFHLAAIVGVSNVAGQPYRVLRDSALALSRILEWSRTLTTLKRFVFPSTSEVYAGTLESFGMKIPTPENMPLTVCDLGRPRTSYMLSKIYGEALCRYAGVPFTIVRPHNVYGPRMGMAHVVPELLERAHAALPGGRLLVFSPNHKRTFCHVDDAVELIVRLAVAPDGSGGTFNVGSPAEETSMARLAELVAATVGKKLEIEAGPETEGSPRRRRPDVEAVIRATSYTPTVSLSEGLRRTYDWYRAHVFAVRGPQSGATQMREHSSHPLSPADSDRAGM